MIAVHYSPEIHCNEGLKLAYLGFLGSVVIRNPTEALFQVDTMKYTAYRS